MKHNKLIVMVFMAITFMGYSQNETDALRYSQTFFGGSARYEAMAGSFGALGADLSVANTNPAGLARFSQNQFTIGANNAILNSKSQYNGTSGSDKGYALSLSNFGALAAIDRTYKGRGWHFLQFGFTYNRTCDYQNRQYYEGQNYNSLLEIFASEGSGVDPTQIFDYKPFTTAIAWDTYALDWDANTSTYVAQLTPGDMYHKRTIVTKGGVSDYNFSFSGNYIGKLYVGGSVGIQAIRYQQNYSHEESLLDTVGVFLRSFVYDYAQTTKGRGINLKLGAIYLPIDNLRIGLAFHTPTILSFKEAWSSTMTSTLSYAEYTIPKQNQPEGSYSYRIRTPLKVIGSFAYVAFSRLALNIDAEYSSYNWIKMKTSNDPSIPTYDFKTENSAIRSLYRSVVNLRIGAELAATSNFFIRGGFAYYPSPYKSNVAGAMGKTIFYTAGVGYKWKFFYVDLSYKLQTGKRNYYAFNPSDARNLTKFNDTKNNILLSLGFRF